MDVVAQIASLQDISINRFSGIVRYFADAALTATGIDMSWTSRDQFRVCAIRQLFHDVLFVQLQSVKDQTMNWELPVDDLLGQLDL